MARNTQILGLQWRTSNRDYLDFLIDGQSLASMLPARDRVGILGGSFPNTLLEVIYLRGLLLEHPAYLETGRFEVYVCPLCGDIGCGSITTEIKAVGDRVIWQHFATEVNYWFDHPSEIFLEQYQLGPLEFDLKQYRQTLLAWPVDRPHRAGPSLPFW
jgi:hypothetical protein